MERAVHPLKAFRQEHGLTVERLAALAGSSRATISRVENCLQTPSVGLIRRLIKVTREISEADRFGRELEPDDFVSNAPNGKEIAA